MTDKEWVLARLVTSCVMFKAEIGWEKKDWFEVEQMTPFDAGMIAYVPKMAKDLSGPVMLSKGMLVYYCKSISEDLVRCVEDQWERFRASEAEGAKKS